jgi:uncharacterized protein
LRGRPALRNYAHMRELAFLLALAFAAGAEAREPIIDVHVHARRAGPIQNASALCAPPVRMPRWDNRLPLGTGLVEESCRNPLSPAASGEAVMRETLAILERRNIFAMASGEPEDLARWRTVAPERIIPGLDLRILPRPASARFQARSIEEVRALHAVGTFVVLGEVMAQYEGVAPDDPRLEPYWALAENLDIPVGIHLGPGNPGEPYQSEYRASGSRPLAMENVLVRHPGLRVYLMHAGYPFVEELRALLFAHPQVYVDVAALVGTEPRPAFYAFLRDLVDAGYGDRIMFGTDQGVWPELIERSIVAIERAPFLSAAQKRDILYNNAARFLRLSPETIARHHAM